MNDASDNGRNSRIRHIPSVDQLLRSDAGRLASELIGARAATAEARVVTGELRRQILEDETQPESSGPHDIAGQLLAVAEVRLAQRIEAGRKKRMHRVINATGVVIHTNLGRAPLSEAARAAVSDAAVGYCTLEYDVARGSRGGRGGDVEDVIAELCEAEAALVVNNCAAAALFVMTAFAAGGEVVVSRGELVEIGGDFRIPDVLSQSGSKLVEIGTTNRTKLADYENNITSSTKMLLRVHPSNYRVVGFTNTPSIADLAELAHTRGLILYEDAGSGALIDMSRFGLGDEPVIADSIAAGAEVVTFSGDKLLGGPQAGIIVGRQELIDRLRKHPLYRALRPDKLAYAALGATLDAYRRGTAAVEVPVLSMLGAAAEDIRLRAESVKSRLVQATSGLNVEVVSGNSAIGGGSGPHVQPKTYLLALRHETLSAHDLERELRALPTRVIARIVDDNVLLDLRTVSETDEEELVAELVARFG
jgi:L-seryl-tRNA(Ser) seleniumtransferase